MKARYSRAQVHAFDKKHSWMVVDYNRRMNRISNESNGVDTINRNSDDIDEYFFLDDDLIYQCAGSRNNSELSSNIQLNHESSKQSQFY